MLNFFKKKETVLLPWVGREAIYSYIKRNLDSEGKLPAEHEELPDSSDFYQDKPFRWAAGAMDGVVTHHANPEEEKAKIIHISKRLRQQIAKPSNTTRRETYLAFMDDGIVGYIDPLLELLTKQSDLNFQTLYHEARWFAEAGAHRGVVKMGIALLGLFRCEPDEELLMTLGKHDEFTLFVAVALKNGFNDSNPKIFELAKQVRGWGKIHLVERLEATSDEIRDWLLRQGCKNGVMPEYLAFTCAVQGNLKEALAAQSIDAELYEGAGEIIAALITGGPAENMDDYDASMPVVQNFLRHASVHCDTLGDLLVIAEIKEYLADEAEVWQKRLEAGWNSETREQCLTECQSLIVQERWRDRVWDDLVSEDNYQEQCAIRAAKILGIDLWERLYAKLHSNPLDSGLYYELMRTVVRERVQRLVAFAEANLPLNEIATGPGTELGLGLEFQAHGCLDMILQDLDQYEGIGGKLIVTGLKSTVIRNRHMALKALTAWNKSSWPEETTALLEMLCKIEPDAELQNRMEEIQKN